MTSSLARLAALGGPALAGQVKHPALDRQLGTSAARVLGSLLEHKNGFYAFEGALHVFPDQAMESERGILDWNSADLWRSRYPAFADDIVCFAEDVFGTQFCLSDGAIVTFDPETGSCEPMAPSLTEWADAVLSEHAFWTGHPLAHDWQSKHGPLPPQTRLVPVTPFALGGAFAVDNLRALDAVAGMRWRADLAAQIRDLPDGATVKLAVVD